MARPFPPKPKAPEAAAVARTRPEKRARRPLRRAAALLCALLAGAAVVPAGHSLAQQAMRIAAVVNDDVISVHDLQARLHLVIATSALDDRPETRQRLAPGLLRNLIDDQLKLQEAKRLGLFVLDEDVKRAFDAIEKGNRLPPGGLDRFLAERGIEKTTLAAQVTPEIAWAKVINRAIRPTVNVPDDEVQAIIEEIRANQGRPEFRVSEIFLPVEDPSNEAAVKDMAAKLIDEIKDGADFESLARSLSKGPSASRGGSLGWMRPRQMDAELEHAIEALEPNQVTAPVRTMLGYHILRLDERRPSPGLGEDDETVSLKQLFIEVAPTAGDSAWQTASAELEGLRARAANCEAMQKLIAERPAGLSGDLGKVRVSSLPAAVATVVRGLAVGTVSAPVRLQGGAALLMVCSREGQTALERARERIREALTAQRVDVAAQHYLRELRRTALVDIRL